MTKEQIMIIISNKHMVIGMQLCIVATAVFLLVHINRKITNFLYTVRAFKEFTKALSFKECYNIYTKPKVVPAMLYRSGIISKKKRNELKKLLKIKNYWTFEYKLKAYNVQILPCADDFTKLPKKIWVTAYYPKKRNNSRAKRQEVLGNMKRCSSIWTY